MIKYSTNCKKKIGINISRVEITFVRGFKRFNVVKILLFTTTFCSSSDMMIMKMTFKWDVTVIQVVESENNHDIAASECIGLPDTYCEVC